MAPHIEKHRDALGIWPQTRVISGAARSNSTIAAGSHVVTADDAHRIPALGEYQRHLLLRLWRFVELAPASQYCAR